MNPDRQKERIREFIAALDRNATADLADMIAADFQFEIITSAPGSSQKVDRNQFLEVMPGVLREMFPNGFNYTCGQALADGTHASMQGSCETVTGSGKRYSNRYHWYFRFQGDKINLFREHLDSYAAFEAFQS
ncbi:nuclear transport factor 2 family protein [Arthrobacter sp. NtRootA1]|uniref:nuclear transport factor 2 family protein n=1 Tax=Micrococcaceae TaxID=1268 RepID=UPI001CC3A6D3|nr:nuclear transport factor 2 family protein [Arthrobacter sp. NtRootA1]BCW05879.1 hypothetical protein NtRootA1_20170 [Arthrobacter sp. NtRootA1]